MLLKRAGSQPSKKGPCAFVRGRRFRARRTHIAIQEALDGVNVVWLDKVTDEQYLSGLSAKQDDPRFFNHHPTPSIP